MSGLEGLEMRGSWTPLTIAAAEALPGCPGVYELAEQDGRVVRIAYAGGRSLFGLRGELAEAARAHSERNLRFRAEQNMQYISRWRELLMVHRRRHGTLPDENPPEDAAGLGYLGTRPTGAHQ